MKVIEDYRRAVESSDEYLFKQSFAPHVCVEIPAGAIFDQPANAAAYQLSQVARTAPGIKCTLKAAAENNWHLLVFEGELEGQKFQAIDQVQLNQDGKIDHIIIYMRPIPLALKFAVAIMQRLQPARQETGPNSRIGPARNRT